MDNIVENFITTDVSESLLPRYQEVIFDHNQFKRASAFMKRSPPKDVGLKAGGMSFTLHKDVISSVSPHLKNIFENAKLKVYHIRMFDSKTIHTVIKYAYTGVLVVNTENVRMLFHAARHLEVEFVFTSCCKFLKDVLHPSNCLGTMKLAERGSLKVLHHHAKNFSELHFSDVIIGHQFKGLRFEDVLELTKSDDLYVSSEEEVYEAVLLWINADIRDRVDKLPKLLATVRLSQMPLDLIEGRMSQQPIIVTDPKCTGLLREAKLFHTLFAPERAQYQQSRFKPRRSSHVSPVLIILGGDEPQAGLPPNHQTQPFSMESYDFREKKWSYLSLNIARHKPGIALHQKCLWFIGGINEEGVQAKVDIYDLTSASWTEGPPLIEKRYDLSAAVLDGLLYAVGGNNGTEAVDTVEVYDKPGGECWTMIKRMVISRSAFGLCVIGHTLLAVGGHGKYQEQPLTSVECYTVVTEQWNIITYTMNYARHYFGVGAIGGLIYVVGGTTFCGSEVYNPALGEWKILLDAPKDRVRPAAAVIDGFLYVIGGSCKENFLNSIDYYNPATNIWTEGRTKMKVKRAGAKALVVDKMALPLNDL